MQALTIQLKNESLAAKLLRCVLRQDQYPTCEEGGKSDGTGDGAGAGAGAGAADSADVDVETPIENGFPLSRGSAGPEPELSAAAESWSRATVMHDVALECATHFTRRLRAEVCRLWMLSLGWSQSSVLSADQAVLLAQVAAGLTPHLLRAYVGWIKQLLAVAHVDRHETAARSEAQKSIAMNIRAILGTPPFACAPCQNVPKRKPAGQLRVST